LEIPAPNSNLFITIPTSAQSSLGLVDFFENLLEKGGFDLAEVLFLRFSVQNQYGSAGARILFLKINRAV